MFSQPKPVPNTETTADTVKALKYKVQVCEGLNDFIHGGGEEIDEIFLPDFKVCCNEKAIFCCENPRNSKTVDPFRNSRKIETPVTVIQLPTSFAEKLVRAANLQKHANQELADCKAEQEYTALFPNAVQHPSMRT